MKTNCEKVKVLFFVPSFNGGGAEKVMSLLINKFNRELFEVIVVTLKQEVSAYKVSADKFIELKVKRVLFSLFGLYRVIKDEKPDFLFSTLTYVNTYIGLLDYIIKFKTVLIARESTIPSINNKQRRLGFLYNLLMLIAYRRFKLIICQSVSMKRDLNEKFHFSNDKLIIINNPVDKKIDNLPLRQQSDIPVFVTVAMLRKEKGIDRIIDALALVTYDFKYFIVGDGSERVFLENKVNELQLSDKILFTGFTNKPYQYLNIADVYLHGSYYEGFPNVILEAGIYGIPSLVFDSIGGTNEIIKNRLNGFIVNDINSFSNKLNNKFWGKYDNVEIVRHTNSLYNIEIITSKYQNIFLTK
jgi:glycosyltransferase involved in cell wall biosynthesis